MLRPQLLIHEWLSVFLILTLLLGLSFSILYHRVDALNQAPSDPIEPIEQLIEVRIEGAVERPGTYQVKKGTPLNEVLQMAMPKPEANLSRLKLDRPLKRKKQVVKVPAKKTANNPRSKRKKT